MKYRPRSHRTRWLRDQIIAALRAHGAMTRKEMAVNIGCDYFAMTATLYTMARYNELAQLRTTGNGEVMWQLGVAAPEAVDVGSLVL